MGGENNLVIKNRKKKKHKENILGDRWFNFFWNQVCCFIIQIMMNWGFFLCAPARAKDALQKGKRHLNSGPKCFSSYRNLENEEGFVEIRLRNDQLLSMLCWFICTHLSSVPRTNRDVVDEHFDVDRAFHHHHQRPWRAGYKLYLLHCYFRIGISVMHQCIVNIRVLALSTAFVSF